MKIRNIVPLLAALFALCAALSLAPGVLAAAIASKLPTKYVGGIGPYPVTLFLDARARAGEKAGHYFYDHRPDSVFNLEMVKNEGDPEGFQEVILHEYTPRGMQSGVFTGRVATRGDGFSGTFVNSRGQSFPFELREAGD